MAPRVLIVRSRPGADATAARVAALGGAPVVAPMLRIRPVSFDRDVARDAQAVLVTSVHGAARIADLAAPPPRVLAVGARTGEAARAAGAAIAMSAEGDVGDLVSLATRVLTPEKGPVVILRGAHVAGDAAGALRAAGFAVEEVVVYEAVAEEVLSDDARAALDAGVDAVLFHSPRGAEAFVDAAARGARLEALKDAAAVCLSANVAEAVPAARFRRVAVAASPNEDSLLEVLKSLLNTGC